MELPVLVAYCNNGYADFAVNMLINLMKNVKRHRLHFYCLDTELYTRLTTQFGTHHLFTFELADLNMSKDFHSYGGQIFNEISYLKSYFIRDALARYSFIHFIDCDIVCINEPPADFYEGFKEYDLVFQYDSGTMYHDGPLHPFFGDWACTGNVSFRNTPGTTYMLEQLERIQKTNAGNDQECLQKYFQSKNITDIRKEPNAKLYMYPIELYTCGFMVLHKLFTTKDTYFFHANHVSGSEAKKNLLRQVGEWYL
jgi:lipopolysaccharide biosynthesis glycosyltransferase